MATKKSLEAAAATSGMFTKANETKGKQAKVKIVSEKTEPKQMKVEVVQAGQEPKKESKGETVPFSCRMDTDTIARWKAFVKVEGYGNMGEMTKQAITEYMKAHPLTKDKKAKYQALYEVSKM